MLPLARESVRQSSRRVKFLLLIVAGCAVALPTVYLSDAPQAVADEAPQKPATTGVTTSSIGPTDPASATGRTYIPSQSPAATRSPHLEFLPELTTSEKQIVSALDDMTELQFSNTPLADAMDFLAAKHEIEIQLDKKALSDAAVDEQAPITRRAKGVSLRSALHLVLDEFDLTYMVADEVLMITSKEKADETISIRTYPIKDLLVQAAETGDRLMKTITGAVAPDAWELNGGPGSISYVAASHSLVVSQSYAVHEQLLNLLRNLRAAQEQDQKESTTLNGPRGTTQPSSAPLR